MEKEVADNKEKQFVYYWYKEFNWKSSPFEYRYLFPVADFIAGYLKERKKLNLFVVESQPLCLIIGGEGFGKTTLLLWLKHELVKLPNAIMLDYVDKHTNLVDFIKLLIKPFLKAKEKAVISSSVLHIGKTASLIGDKNLKAIYESVYLRKKELDLNAIKELLYSRLKNKSLVLLVDDYDEIPEQNKKIIEILVNSEINMQVVIASTKNIENLLKKKEVIKIELNGIEFEDAKKMLKKRIESVEGDELEPFSEEQLKGLHAKCNKSPLVFLNLCKDKAVKLAIDRIGRKKDEIEYPKKQEMVDNKPSSDSEKIRENKKSYEIKVVNSGAVDSDYEIKMVQPKNKGIPVKVEEEERKAVKVDKDLDKQQDSDKEKKKGKK